LKRPINKDRQLKIINFECINLIPTFATQMVVVAQLVRASVCGTEGRGFEPHHPPLHGQAGRNAGFFVFVESYFFTGQSSLLQILLTRRICFIAGPKVENTIFIQNLTYIMKKILLIALLITHYILLNAQAPVISSFSPVSGAPGTLVTIKGKGLVSPTTFSIGAYTALVVSGNDSQLVGLVMPSASTGPISITTSGGTVKSSNNFAIMQTSCPSIQQGNKLVGLGSFSNQGYYVSISADGNTVAVGAPFDNAEQGSVIIYNRFSGKWLQDGNKLVGTGAIFTADQGISVALSADGKTVIFGGNGDNGSAGAIWIFTRIGGVWTQQGGKLVGSGIIGPARLGSSISISADGNTAIVGGYNDNNGIGAVWIFTRLGSTWSQQGSKLLANDIIGAAQQGYSVSISADGNTAVVGGSIDNNYAGAAWIYTRSGSIWTQQGNKLVGKGAIGNAFQGGSVSISAEGNTAIVGGNSDNKSIGAVWIYTRSGGVWMQQGNKLVGSGGIGSSQQGYSVAMSADGNTAIFGALGDNSNIGAAWTFKRSSGIWTQAGNKLVGTGAIGVSYQGNSVALSADGNTAVIGGNNDNSGIGAAWIYAVQPIITGLSVPSEYNLNVFPNPSTGILNIGFLGSCSETLIISITNIQGQVVYQSDHVEKILDLSAVPKGLYFLHVQDAHEGTCQKIIIQ
jgi:hypothetical protein